MMRVAFLAIGCFFWTTAASAQVCMGQAPIRSGSAIGLGVGVRYGEGTNFSGGPGGGGDHAFGRGTFGVTRYAGPEFGAWTTSVVAGGQVTAGTEQRVAICPFGAVDYEWKDNIDDSGVDLSVLTAAAGLSVGFIVAQSATVEFVPTVGVSMNRTRADLPFDVREGAITTTYEVLHLGVGFVIDRRSAVTPTVVVPVGYAQGRKTFSLTFTYSFGG